MTTVLALIGGACLGALAAYLVAGRRHAAETARLQAAADARVRQAAGSREEIANQVKAATAEALDLAQQQLRATTDELRRTDAVTAGRALKEREDAVRRLTDPLTESIRRVEKEARQLGEARLKGETEIRTMLAETGRQVGHLQKETGNLVTALRKPQTRGQWGETQLRRCFEIAGMSDHVDYLLQDTVAAAESGNGARLRPDARVLLPGGRHIVVDAKVALDAYLDSLGADDEAGRRGRLADHARQMRTHVDMLAGKAYGAQFEIGQTPDFVILFTPEASLSAAVEADPGITDYSLDRGIIMTTPSLLVALLKTIALGWREQRLAEQAREIAETARQLHARFGTFLNGFDALGRRLDSAVGEYNRATGSLEGRLLPQLRRIENLGAGSGRPLPEPAPIDRTPRNRDTNEGKSLHD